MKILVVCQHYYPEPFRVTDICEKLAKRGHSVTVLTATGNYQDDVYYPSQLKSRSKDEVINDVHVLRCDTKPRGKKLRQRIMNYFSFPRSGKKLAKHLDEQFDVVFVYQLSPIMMAEPGLYYGKLHDVPVLLYELDPWPSNLTAGGIKENSMVYRYFARVSKRIYSSSSRVLVSSKPHIHYLETLCERSLNIGYLPQYALEEGQYQISSSPDFHFLYAGNVGQALPIEIMLSSFKRAFEKNPHVYLDIAGTGTAFEEAQQYCKDHEINNVIFHGWMAKEQFEEVSKQCKVAIVLLNHQFYSRTTVPGKVSTYMKLGMPILAADDWATKEMMEEAKCGICVPTSDEDAITEGILRFASMSDSQLLEYSKNGMNYYEENMSEERFFNQLEDELKNLCKK